MKNYNRLIFLLIIILLIWNVTLTVFVFNNNATKPNNTNLTETTVTGFSTDLTKVIGQSKKSVVTVESNITTSTGFVYSVNDKAYIVTTYHGLNNENPIKVVFDNGANYDATLLDKDIFADIAVLEVLIDTELPEIKLGNSNVLKDGEYAVTIGTPKSVQYSSSSSVAIVSSALRSINNSIVFEEKPYEYISNVIQLTANINPGYSGAPVFNMAGEVVGVITMKDDTAVFALPINEVKIIVDNIIAGNVINKKQFGIKGLFVSNIESYEKNQLNIPLDVNNGYYVNNVRIASLASNIGILQGDVILSINDIQIETYDDLLSAEYLITNVFNIKVIRNNETISLTGTIND